MILAWVTFREHKWVSFRERRRRSGYTWSSRDHICERLLKLAIQHRTNSLFFKTADGAKVGDLFMSLIATAVLSGANALDYLTEIQRHAVAAAEHPADWLPWNYRATLAPVNPDPPVEAAIPHRPDPSTKTALTPTSPL